MDMGIVHSHWKRKALDELRCRSPAIFWTLLEKTSSAYHALNEIIMSLVKEFQTTCITKYPQLSIVMTFPDLEAMVAYQIL